MPNGEILDGESLESFTFLHNTKVSWISGRDIVQELCESRGGRPELSVLTSLLDVMIYCTVLRHWSQLVPNMSTDIRGY